MRKQKGFTLLELIFAIIGIAGACMALFMFYAAFHFIMKFW